MGQWPLTRLQVGWLGSDKELEPRIFTDLCGVVGVPWDAVEQSPEQIGALSRQGGGPSGYLGYSPGGYDLTTLGRKVILQAMKTDLGEVSKQMGQCEIMWSEIVPRRVWHEAMSCEAVEHSRRQVNSSMRKFTEQRGLGFCATQDDPGKGKSLLGDGWGSLISSGDGLVLA